MGRREWHCAAPARPLASFFAREAAPLTWRQTAYPTRGHSQDEDKSLPMMRWRRGRRQRAASLEWSVVRCQLSVVSGDLSAVGEGWQPPTTDDGPLTTDNGPLTTDN